MQIDPLFVGQIGLAVLAVFGLAFFISLQQSTSHTRALQGAAVLCAFLIDHHPRYRSIQDIAEDKTNSRLDKIRTIWSVNQALNNLRSGDVSQVPEEPEMLSDLLRITLWGPYYACIILWQLSIEMQLYRYERIEHSEARLDAMSKAILLAISTFVWCAISYGVFMFTQNTIALIVSAILTLTLVVALILGLWIVRQQLQWKSFWSIGLGEVMIFSTKANDHDVFNRALLLRQSVEAAANVPLPGGIGYYTAVYALAHASLVFVWQHLSTIDL